MFADKFGWTPTEVDKQPAQVIDDLRLIMHYQQKLAPQHPTLPEVPHGRGNHS